MGQIITSQFNVATVEKGENSIYLDLSNDNDSILYIDGAAKNTCVTTITLYDGAKDVTAQAVVTHTATGCTVTKSGRTYTVTAITGDNVKGTVLISAAYNGQNYSNTFTITKLVDKDRYELICSPNSVTVNTTTGAKSASAIKVEIYKTPYTTGIRAKLNTLDGGHSLKYYVNNGVSPTAISFSGGSGSFNVDANNSSYRVVLASGDVELDSETIPINKSENGLNGENAVRIDISNEMDMIPTTTARLISAARTVETIVRLFDGASEVNISTATLSPTGGPASTIATFSQTASGKGKKLSWAFIAGQTMAEAYEIVISYTYNSVSYSATFTVCASKGEAVWQLKPSLSAIPFQRNSDNTLTPASRAVGLSLVKIDGGSTATYTSVQTGLTVRYSTSSMPSSASAGTGWSSGNITVANSAENLYIALFNASGVLLDRETIPVVKDGENGFNVVRLDISNEMDMIPTTAALRIDVARTVETTVRLYDGSSEIDISSATISVSGGPASSIATFSQAASGKGRKLSWAFKAGQTMAAAYEITVSYTYKSVAYTAVFTVIASKGEAVWQLKPSLSAIPFQRNSDNTLTPASQNVGLSLVKIDGSSTATYTSVQTGLTVRYSTSSMPSSASAGTGWSSGNITVANTADNLYIAMFNSSGTLLDRETVPVIKDGENGKSITKKSESYRYATNNTGVRPAASSSDWKTTKPTLQKGYWLYVEITITWSDNSTTVLYTEERNPNDGVAGQDIIVDGSTDIKYYVGDSNTTHPAESSSDWKDISQVVQTQGKWLWSKATTWYRKASSAEGSHDGGKSVNYNVSYIAKDGASGRSLTGVTEYYKATNSDAEMPVPTSDTGWSTNPNVSNWGETDKYLWNYEKMEYSSGTTVERTKPQIVAIWTKDGKGIDSIVNYYKITQTSTPPTRPSVDGGDGWDDTPTAPGQGEYLWNYENVTYTDGTVYRSEVELTTYVGKDGEKGDDGNDGYGVVLVLFRDIYSEEQWNEWAVVGQSDSYSKKSGDDDFLKCRVGDFFMTTGTATNSGKRHTAIWKCTAVTASLITGICVSHVTDGDPGSTGHIGRWYEYYGDVTSTAATLSNTDDHGWFIKKGDYFYMLITDSGVSKSTTTAPSTATSNEFWEYMGGDRKYYIGEAFFGNYAHLGSFIINGDWMISQYGYLYVSASDVRIVNTRDQKYYNGQDYVLCYTYFKPSDPTCTGSGSYPKFAPSWAVDGLQGKQYHNGRSGGYASYVSLDDDGFAVRWGGDGIKVGADGLQRLRQYTSYNEEWLPMFNKRNILVDGGYASMNLPSSVDYFLNTNKTHTEDNRRNIYLPDTSELPNGAIVTIRGVFGAWGMVKPKWSNTERISMGDVDDRLEIDMEGADCVEFILVKKASSGLSYETWLCNYYDRNY